MTDLSVLIPARQEVFLQRTIDDVLAHAEADTEVVVVLDGGWPAEPIPDNPRVVIIHHTEPRGQRASINEAARIARGRYVMKMDAHCSVSQGFDRQLIADWQPGWTLVPLMYNLDVEKWEPKLHKQTRAMFLTINEKGELRAEYYSRQPKFDSPVHETMACMGPGWFLSAEDFWRTGGCDEEHGSWGAQSVEVSLKAWLSGGALMTDENCWFAHWFRGDVGFPYPMSGRAVDAARKYSKALWLNDAWPGQTRSLRSLVEQFDPPGWADHQWEEKPLPAPFDEAARTTMNRAMYHHLHMLRHEPTWRGLRVIKQPSDLQLYHEIIWQTKPKWIVETGSAYGGSCVFFQDMLDLIGEGGRVVTVDVNEVPHRDPRVTYLRGSSRDRAIVQQITEMVGGEPTMLVLDSSHARFHVKWELHLLSPLVTPGQYLVIEDCYRRGGTATGPAEARDWFLRTRRGQAFEQTNLDRKYLVGYCVGGFLRRRA